MQRRIFMNIAVCLSGMLFTTGAYASDGWQNLKWGMSVTDVERLYPVAEKLCTMNTDECDKANTSLLSQGLNTNVANIDLKITLVFKKGCLQRVVMSPQDSTASDPIYVALVKDYGSPTNTNGAIREWRDGQTIIMLVAPAGQTPGILFANINDMNKN